MELEAWSETSQVAAAIPVIHFLEQQSIFEAAVNSFFRPPVRVQNLFFAVEWFAMDATYNESRLMNAMTALENLVESNLPAEKKLIRPEKEFEKLRSELRKTIRGFISAKSDLDEPTAKTILNDMDARMSDLNRRTILEKIKILATLWSVPLDGLGEQNIKDAKRARDLIIHRGHYYKNGKGGDIDLWVHVTYIRELFVRFVLTAIAYKGQYISHVDGYHHATFPPKPVDA